MGRWVIFYWVLLGICGRLYAQNGESVSANRVSPEMVRENTLRFILGAPREIQPILTPESAPVRSRAHTILQLTESVAPLQEYLRTGQIPEVGSASGSRLNFLSRIGLLVEMARGGNIAKPFIFNHTSIAKLEAEIIEHLRNPRVQANALAILDQSLVEARKGGIATLRTQPFDPVRGQFERLALPSPERIQGMRDSNTIRTSETPYVRPINQPQWRTVDGVLKKFYAVEVYIDGKWKEVLFPDTPKAELAKWTPEKLGQKLSSKSFVYELPTTVVGFALSIYLYERIYAVLDQDGPDRFNERFVDTISDGNVWAVAAGLYGGTKALRFGAAQLPKLRKVLKLEEAKQIKLDLDSDKTVTPAAKAKLKRLGRAMFSATGVGMMIGGVVGMDLILSYRRYLKACSQWANPNLEMTEDQRLSLLVTCEEGFNTWAINGKVQQFTPLILATAGYFGLSSLAAQSTAAIRRAPGTQKAVSTLRTTADWHLWSTIQQGGKAVSTSVEAHAARLGFHSLSQIKGVRYFTPAQELTGVVVRGLTVTARAGAYGARMVVGMFSGPIGGVMVAWTVIDLSYDWWRDKIDRAVQVVSVQKWQDVVEEKAALITRAKDEGILWELPEECEKEQKCIGTIVGALDLFRKRMDGWREIILRDTIQAQAEWLEYLSQFASKFQATQRFYVDLVAQVNEMRGSAEYSKWQTDAAELLKVKDTSTSEELQYLAIEKFADRSLPLYRSEPLNGFGGPILRNHDWYVHPDKKEAFLKELDEGIALAKEDGRDADELQLVSMKKRVDSGEARATYAADVKKLILAEKEFIERVANDPKTIELNRNRLMSFIEFAEDKKPAHEFLTTLQQIKLNLPARDEVCRDKKTEEKNSSRYIGTCVFHILIEKLGLWQPLLPGEAYVRIDADKKLSEQGIDIDIKPESSFGSANVSLSEYFLKQTICGPALTNLEEVLPGGGGWDLEFVPFRLVNLTDVELKQVCRPVSTEGVFDPFMPVVLGDKTYLNAVDLLTERIDPQFLPAMESSWWQGGNNSYLNENIISYLDNSVEQYKADVIDGELRSAFGGHEDKSRSFANWIPSSLSDDSVGNVPSHYLATVIYEIDLYFQLIIGPIVADERNPMSNMEFVTANGYAPEEETSERAANQQAKMNFYEALDKQYKDALTDLAAGDHENLTDLKNKYVYLKDCVHDLEVFLNLSTDEDINSLGINILSQDSSQFISVVVMERIKKLNEELFQTLLMSYSFDPLDGVGFSE